MKLFVAVLVLCGVQVVFSCTCNPYPGHLQHLYCTSDIVIIGKIVKVTVPEEENANIEYVVRVKRAFRGDVEGKIIVTSVNSQGACGITNLKKGETYLLSAKKKDDGTYSISLCSSIVIEKKDITRKLKKSLDAHRSKSFPGKHEVNCQKCKIQYCGFNGNCGIVPPPQNTCTYFDNSTVIECFNKERCVPNKSYTSCKWTDNDC